MKVTIGGREQVFSASLMMPKNEEAWLEFRAATWDIKVNVKFIDDLEVKEQTYVLSGKGDHAVLTLKNWNSAMPLVSEELIELGATKEGRKVLFLLSGFSVAGFKKLDISFFLGAE